ncbi:hypothetical protein H9P43_009961 [Blastocladiella emersonii ATCC 22665]|nr:hypothetical protein H9P43_009961 [Blastocladiella emersonii ATCC 22665]
MPRHGVLKSTTPSLMHLPRAPWLPPYREASDVPRKPHNNPPYQRPRKFAREPTPVPLLSGSAAMIPMWRAFEPPQLSTAVAAAAAVSRSPPRATGTKS